MNNTKTNQLLLTLSGILLICIFLTAQFSWRGPDKKGYTHVIDSDGKGYYLYLPAIFINKNLASQSPDERYIFKTEHGAVNKYFAGTAIAMLPFFGAGYISAVITHKPLTGYSPPFQRAISIAGWFYLLLGLFFLSQLLLLYNININVICLTLPAILFGTNLLMYAVYHPSFSHIYSFCFVAMFLYYAKTFFISSKLKPALLATFALGIITAIRPSNAMIILSIPFLAGDIETFKNSFKQLLNIRLLLIVLLFSVFVLLQMSLWYVQTHQFILQSYRYEGFYFSHPQIINVLFSFRKGFFIYTPLALVALCGLYIIGKRSRFELYSLLIFFILLIYFTSSWWNWYYGPSFGQRPFIEFYPLFALLLAILLSSFSKIRVKILYAIISVLVLFNLIQSFQYVKNIISPWDMDYSKYKYTFLGITSKYYNCLGGSDDIVPYPGIKTFLREAMNNYEKPYPGWSRSKTKIVGSDKKTVADFSNIEFNSSYDIYADTMMTNYRLLYAHITLDRNELVPCGKSGALLGIMISNKQKKTYHYATFLINKIPNKVSNRWETFSYTTEIPKVKEQGDIIRFYIWNKDKQPILVDNFHITLYGIN